MLRLSVLGATGFVGGALLRHLAGRARERPGSLAVRALERRSGALPRAIAGAPTAGWLTPLAGSLEELPGGLFFAEPHAVIHLATKQLDADGGGFEAVNVEGTRRLLAALPPSAQAVLYGSSLSVAGQGPQRGEREEDLPPRPGTALARSRAAAEALVLASAAGGARSALCLRPRFVLGRGDRHTLPALLRLTRRGWRAGSGRQAASAIDVDDYGALLARLAAVALARAADGAPLARALHVGYRRPLALGEVQAALARRFDLAPPRRPLWLPGPLLPLLRALGAGRLATRYELVALDHHGSVAALEALVGDDVVGRDPREALERAVELLAAELAAEAEAGAEAGAGAGGGAPAAPQTSASRAGALPGARGEEAAP